MKRLFFVLSILFMTNNYGQNFMFNVEYGPSLRLAKNSGQTPQQKDLIRELKKGNALRLKALYFINEQNGFGLVYNRFTSKKSNYSESFYDNGDRYIISFDEQDNINFLGICYENGSFSSNDKHYFGVNIALGYMELVNNFEYKNIAVNDLEFKGSNLGLDFGINYKYFIIEKIALGASLHLPYTTIGKFKGNDGTTINLEQKNRESTARFDLTFGITAFL
ncbi:MAG: hypothetical protein H6604_01865 [Flavobacteriales bacterium]|nr:hypothetical protein [Flavobacteriales bacterium]